MAYSEVCPFCRTRINTGVTACRACGAYMRRRGDMQEVTIVDAFCLLLLFGAGVVLVQGFTRYGLETLLDKEVWWCIGGAALAMRFFYVRSQEAAEIVWYKN